MHFRSDNWAGAHPKISAALTENAEGFAAAYGTSDADRLLGEKFNELFGREVAVFTVGTGTAANALAMTAVNRPGGVIFCHPGAHLREDECGAPEYFTGGARICTVDGPLGRFAPDDLETAIRQFPADFIHNGQPMAASITQCTEIGTTYKPDEIAALSAVCRKHGIPLHMDGARFANAVVSLDLSPAAMSVDLGIDILSFGGTKNGCWCAEAVVFFDLDLARDMAFLRKRAAQLFSKSRFIAAQFNAYFEDDLWIDLARHSNRMAARLAEGLSSVPGCRLAWQPEGNEVFPIMTSALGATLEKEGALFYDWPAPATLAGDMSDDEMLCRFVTSFATTPEEVDHFCNLAMQQAS